MAIDCAVNPKQKEICQRDPMGLFRALIYQQSKQKINQKIKWYWIKIRLKNKAKIERTKCQRLHSTK